MSRPNNRLVVLETVQYRVYTPKPQPQPKPEEGFPWFAFWFWTLAAAFVAGCIIAGK